MGENAWQFCAAIVLCCGFMASGSPHRHGMKPSGQILQWVGRLLGCAH